MKTKKDDLGAFFQTQGIPKDKVKYYVRWLDRFWGFYNSGLRDLFLTRMRLRHYAYNTEKSYREWIRRFLLYTEIKSPGAARPEHVKRFLTYLAVDKKVTGSNQNQAFTFNALLFLYQEILQNL